jgi:hypothetical protein
VEGLAAGLARSRFALDVLQEAVHEVIFRPRAPGGFHSLATAVGTDKFEHVFLRIPIQSGPTRVSNAYDIFRMRIAIHGQRPRSIGNDKLIDAGLGRFDAVRVFFLNLS